MSKPAFPQGHQDGPEVDPSGMSLKEYATIQCMKALLSNPSVVASCPLKGWTLVNCTTNQLAEFAAHIADETIAAAEARSRHGRPTGEA